MNKHITHLSFSRLKALAHSPLALKAYIEGTKVVTDAMNAGSLLDCHLFTPQELDDRFYIMPKTDRRTTAGKAAYEYHTEQAGERILVTEEDYNDAQELAGKIRGNSTVKFYDLLGPNFSFQHKIEFFYSGFKHVGIADAVSNIDTTPTPIIWDLKRMGATSGEKEVRYQIRKMKYDLQAAIYCHPFDSSGKKCRFFLIACDNSGYVTPFEITRDAREQARYEWNMLIRAAHRCNMEGLEMGVEFWAESDGFFKY